MTAFACNLHDPRVEMRGNRAFLDAIVDIGPDPVLDAVSERDAPMDEGHVRAATKELQRRLGCRILAADDDHALAVVRMGVGVVVRDVGEGLSRHAEIVRVVVVPDGQYDRARVPRASSFPAHRCW